MSERWKPEVGDFYYFVSTAGDILPDTFKDDYASSYSRFAHGNCFKTKEEASAAAVKVRELLLNLHEQPTDCSQLPKLSAEVFNRPDCPEWARYAAVRENGIAIWFEVKPNIGRDYPANKFWYSTWSSKNIPGEWDASDWQNSLIERPTKKELPEWCKVGEFVYARDIKCYFKIKEIYNDGILLQDPDNEDVVSNLCTEFFMVRDPIQAHYRPYEAEEMYELLGKYIEDAEEVMLVTGFYKKDNLVKAGDEYYDAERLFNECTINGNPCGKLVHLNEQGEWVE